MCAERLSQFVTLVFVLATFDPARGTHANNPLQGPQDRSFQQKGRLSLQNTGKCTRPRSRELLGECTVHPRGAPQAARQGEVRTGFRAPGISASDAASASPRPRISGTEGPRSWAAPCTQRTLPSQPASRTFTVLPPSPAPSQVSKPRNGDTTRTVRLLCSTGSWLTRKLQSRARRAGHGAGPFPSSERERKSANSSFAPRPPPPTLGSRAIAATAACVRSPHEQESTSAH
ncbi:hypothetical protein P7K49_005456 [Saguinus oedipus]|uniref:Secreted protein n=1 Tax=Saguinus oedipus TaxID=9490 RepID=A0ABQ9WBX9_SAGOE|nr:hypothetical protein P7K49_005456 [Saguinus oedipus]